MAVVELRATVLFDPHCLSSRALMKKLGILDANWQFIQSDAGTIAAEGGSNDSSWTNLKSVAVIAKPLFGSASISGNGFKFTGTGGVANANFYLLGTTNLANPLNNWTWLLTNQFDNNGNFNFTNALDPNWPQGFYLLQLP